MDKTWLDPLLAQHLERVAAPEELWNRILTPHPIPLERSGWSPRLMWGLTWAAAALLVVSIATWRFYPRTQTKEALAAKAISQGFSRLEFRSSDTAQIRAWVKSRTGLEVPFPGEPSRSIHLMGARVDSSSRVPTAEVVYQVGDRQAVLLVSKAESGVAGNGAHRFLGNGAYRGARLSSWTMRGQLYTLACPISENPNVGCQLCHANGSPRTGIN